MKKTTSIILCLVMIATTVLLSSCSNLFAKGEYDFPEGYTGGFRRYSEFERQEVSYWVETYDELVAAMELLKSHGSTFAERAIFTYEGDLFDTKYSLTFRRKKSDKIKYGEDPFDRWAEDVVVLSWAFYDEVSIDELNYSYVQNYKCYGIYENDEFFEWYENHPNYKRSDLTVGRDYDSYHDEFVRVYNLNNVQIASIAPRGLRENEVMIPESGQEAILGSLTVVE